MSEPVHPAQLLFTEKHPLTASLKMEFEVPRKGELWVHVPAPESFADADSNLVHTGFNSLFLDTVMGSCAIGELINIEPIATIKLNCHHLGRAKVGEKLTCKAIHDGTENQVIYVRGEIIRSDSEEIISHAIGTFMSGTATKSIREKTS